MDKVNIHLSKSETVSYEIRVNSGLLEKIPGLIKNLGLKGQFVIITDSNVKPLYADKLYESMTQAGFQGLLIHFEAGEIHKTRRTKEMLEDEMLSQRIGRDSFILALGGGVTGDIAGYIAATYNRGIPFIQIPTTLLAMVDSSVGGKTGVDTPYGKNLIGAFCQPAAVYADIDTLTTLEKKEILNGISEMIKHACIQDRSLFVELRDKKEKILSLESALIQSTVIRNVAIKAAVVEEDEKEGNKRQILNFGHTAGHAIELLTDFTLSHGECVAIGMCVAADISVMLNLLSEKEAKEIKECISGFGLPIKIPENLRADKIIEAMGLDKKSRQGKVKFVLLETIGKVHVDKGNYSVSIEEDILLKALHQNF